jgi:hypothetical protein
MKKKKMMVGLSTALLLFWAAQGGVNAQPLSPVRPAEPAIPAVPNGPGTPATPAEPANPASPAVEHRVVAAQEGLEGAEEALDNLSDAGGEGSINNPVVPTQDNSQGANVYTAVLNPAFDEAAWVEAPSAAAPGWEFSVLQGSRRVKNADFPGSEDEIFILIVGTQQFEVKGGETYKFTPPVSNFVIKRKNNTAAKLSVGLHYTGTGRTKLGMTPVN